MAGTTYRTRELGDFSILKLPRTEITMLNVLNYSDLSSFFLLPGMSISLAEEIPNVTVQRLINLGLLLDHESDTSKSYPQSRPIPPPTSTTSRTSQTHPTKMPQLLNQLPLHILHIIRNQRVYLPQPFRPFFNPAISSNPIGVEKGIANIEGVYEYLLADFAG